MFPAGPGGRRSTAAFGRAVVADALRVVDPAAAAAAEREADWRRGYLPHFRALSGTGDGYAVARAGLAAVHARMVVTRDGGDVPLGEVFDAPVPDPLSTIRIRGGAPAEKELLLPYRGTTLRGADLHRRLDAWVAAGVVEPSCAEAVREVAANPDWLDLSHLRLVVLGAGSEMGPLLPVLRWGGTVAGIDLPRPAVWDRIRAATRSTAGTLLAPASGEQPGADLLSGLPALAQWLLGLDERLVLGMYGYADGATHVRLSAAADALGGHLRGRRPDTGLAFLATPTDVFTVPADAVAAAAAAYRGRGAAARALRVVSGGRLLAPNYTGEPVNDSLVPQQGPNYALAKRIQRWRASAARQDGATVALTVAPPTRTRSVLKNRALAAAYAGGHRFGVEVFEPATSNTLMAALLVHQLRRPRPAAPAVWQDEAWAAAHGGLWRIGYRPRTALGLAAVLGFAGAGRGLRHAEG